MMLTLGLMIMGCATTPTTPHSFAAEGSPDVATITFMFVGYSNGASASVSFFSYGDIVTEKKENWNPVSFPADNPLQFTVKANFNPVQAGGLAAIVTLARTFNGKQVVFDCPPLEAGKSYSLWSVSSDGPLGAGTHTLVLTETPQEGVIKSGDALIMALRTRDKLVVVAEQEFKK